MATSNQSPITTFSGVVRSYSSVGAFEAVLALVGAFFVLRIPERPRSQQFPLGAVAALAFGFSFLKLASRGRTVRGDFVIREGALWQQSGRFICGLPRGLFAYSEPGVEAAHRRKVLILAHGFAVDHVARKLVAALRGELVRVVHLT